MTEQQLRKAGEEGACLQRIQMAVWKYMELPMAKRNGVEMANEIFEDVKKVVEEEAFKEGYQQAIDEKHIDY